MILKIDNEKLNPSDLEIVMSGPIDEETTYPNVSPRLSQRIVIDCEGISYINSYGIQKWSLWMRAFDERVQFVFRRVPRRLVELFNSIKDFLPKGAVVESFYVPFECDNCEHEEPYWAQRGRDYVEAYQNHKMRIVLPDEINCPKCKGILKVGVWESRYFRFLEDLV